MEVHAHTHTARKKWTHYFWEFLMLFLAVFCGFLAEYQLEHKIERDRAKEFAKNLYEELKNDSIIVAEKSKNRLKMEKALQYLKTYYKDSSLTTVSKTFAINFHYGCFFRQPTLFEPKTIVLEQLQNSGSLRYFKSEKLQKLVGDITITIQNIKERQAYETDYRKSFIVPLMVNQYDTEFEIERLQFGGKNVFENMLAYESADTIIPFRLNSPEKIDRQESARILNFYGIGYTRGTRTVQFQNYIDVNAALLKELRKAYHLK